MFVSSESMVLFAVLMNRLVRTVCGFLIATILTVVTVLLPMLVVMSAVLQSVRLLVLSSTRLSILVKALGAN